MTFLWVFSGLIAGFVLGVLFNKQVRAEIAGLHAKVDGMEARIKNFIASQFSNLRAEIKAKL